MFYTYEVTAPTKIKSVKTYKKRVYEITHGQIKNVVIKERFIHPFFWLLAIFFIPLSVVYLFLCLCEIVVDTILLPLSCVPYLRGVAVFVSIVVWSLCVCVGCISIIPMTYDLDYCPKKKAKKASADNSTIQVRNEIVSKQMNIAADLYVRYGAISRFDDDMGVLCEEYTNILSDGENAYGIKGFYFGINNYNLSSAERKCIAMSMYYLFDLSDINYSKDKVISVVSQIIFNETYTSKSIFDSVSWLEVRLALIEKMKGFVEYHI